MLGACCLLLLGIFRLFTGMIRSSLQRLAAGNGAKSYLWRLNNFIGSVAVKQELQPISSATVRRKRVGQFEEPSNFNRRIQNDFQAEASPSSIYLQRMRSFRALKSPSHEDLRHFCAEMLPILQRIELQERPYVVVSSILHTLAKKFAVSSVDKSAKPISAAFLAAWYAANAKCSQFFDAHGLANTIYAHALLELQPEPNFLRNWYKSAICLLPQFNDQALTNSLQAFALLRVTPSSDFMTAWFNSAERASPNFSQLGLSNALYALGQLNAKPPKSFLAQFTVACKTKLEEFTPQSLSLVMRAFSLLNEQPTEAFMQRWYSSVARKMSTFDERALATAFHALSTVQLTPPGYFLKQFYEVAGHRMGYFNQQELTNILYALALLSLRPPKEFAERWFFAAGRKLNDFDAQALSNSIYAIAKLRIAVPRTFLDQWFAHAGQNMRHFAPQELANLMTAFANLELRPSPTFLDEWFLASEDKMPEFKHLELSASICSLAQLKLIPAETFLSVWFENAERRLNEFGPRQLCNCFFALAQLRLDIPVGVLRSLCGSILRNLDALAPQELAQCFLASVFLQISSTDADNSGDNSVICEPLLDAVFARIVDLSSSVELGREQLTAIHSVCQYLTLTPSDALQMQLEKTKRELRKEKVCGSALQDNFAIFVKRFIQGDNVRRGKPFWRVEEECWNDVTATKIDVALHRIENSENGQETIFIQLDGPSHFLQPGDIVSVETLLQSAIMKRNNQNVIRIPHFEWERLQSDAERFDFIAKYLEPYS